MKLPKLQKPEKYVSLYAVDFGEHSSVGYTAEEVAELLESEKFKDCKVYKIHNAYPDGRLELKGVSPQTFQLESGMFFFADNLGCARNDFERLTNLAVTNCPPCRAKIHLAKLADDKYATALIYPAEYDDDISNWLLENDYKTQGPVEGGVSSVTSYYDAKPQILERNQLFAQTEWQSRSGSELLAATKLAVQR